MGRALLFICALVTGALGCASPTDGTDGEDTGESASSALGDDAYRVYAALAEKGGAAPAQGFVAALPGLPPHARHPPRKPRGGARRRAGTPASPALAPAPPKPLPGGVFEEKTQNRSGT